MKKIIILSLFFMLIFFNAVWAGEISLTLDEAVSLALRDNRDILFQNADLEKAKAKINEARASLFPSLTLGGGLSDSRSLYSKNISGFSAQAGVSQVIYSGGKVLNAVKISEYNYIATKAALDKIQQETIFNVKKAFYALLLSEKFQVINKAIVDNANEHLGFIQACFSAGQVSESEVIKTRSLLAEVIQANEASIGQGLRARALLNNLLFLREESEIKARGEFVCQLKEMAYDQAFLKALRLRPEIQQLEARRSSAEKGVELAKSDSRPQVSAAWNYYSSSRASGGSTKNWNDHNVLGVVLNWRIFDGRLVKSKVEQAIIDLKETRLLKEKMAADIGWELKTAYLDLKDSLEKIKSVNTLIDVYRDNLAVIIQKYQAGMVSELDLHDAQLSYEAALFNQVQANYDYVIAKVKFQKATGGEEL